MSAVAGAVIKGVLAYLADRNRSQPGSWISVADVSGALGYEWDGARDACRSLGDSDLAEFMGGFPLKLTQGSFTLVRLTDKGRQLAEDPQRLDELLGGSS